MTTDERSRLETLDHLVRSESVRAKIAPIVARLRRELAAKPEALMTWEPIPLAVFDNAVPAEIRSGWVFVLRAGTDTGPERHPNSHQRMMSLDGSGDLQTEEDGKWRSNPLISEPGAPLQERWISVPAKVWHRPIVTRDKEWTVVSFHTVPAEELIEERLHENVPGGTKRMRYLDTAN